MTFPRRFRTVAGVAAVAVATSFGAGMALAQPHGPHGHGPGGPADGMIAHMIASAKDKLALNTITTATFTRLGKVYGNRMVDLQPKSAKLRARAERLVAELGGVSRPRARRLLLEASGSAKVAIVMARHRESAASARRRLSAARGFLGRALEG